MNRRATKRGISVGLVLLVLYLLPASAMILGKYWSQGFAESSPTALDQYNDKVKRSLQKNAEEVDYLESSGRITLRRSA